MNTKRKYWVKVFWLYAITEACIQLLFNFILNNFRNTPISNIEFHGVMWFFQCLFIIPIWWIAHRVYRNSLPVQLAINLLFFIAYMFAWFFPVQEIITVAHQSLQTITRPASERIPSPVDSISNIDYQLVKYAFRLSWFYLANYFYYYRAAEQKRRELAVANKQLELKLLTWQLNPSFYFDTISHLQKMANVQPSACGRSILELAKVMEYVIYETKQRYISVARELHFLNSYTGLLNQKQNGSSFTMKVSGSHEKLIIAPLLLVGFIDKLKSDNSNGASTQRDFLVLLDFSNSHLTFSIETENPVSEPLLVNNEEPLYRRIEELYHQRFKFYPSNHRKLLHLELNLDE